MLKCSLARHGSFQFVGLEKFVSVLSFRRRTSAGNGG